MNDSKILIICSILILLLTALGINDSYGTVKWSIFSVSFVITAICLSSKRYYWASVFVFFALLFNPWLYIRLTKTEWIFADILLAGALALFALDSYRNYRKGVLFEHFVQNQFPDSTHSIKSATKDLHKKLKRFVETDGDPDFVFRNKRTGKTFAIECKYRSSYAIGKYGDEGIWWNKSTGDRYVRYGQRENIPVYVCIGVGGNPKAPREFSFIPIEIIQKQYFYFIPKKILAQYKQIPM